MCDKMQIRRAQMTKSKAVLFEVLRDGRVLMSTEHESCIYPNETLLSMQTAGYKFRLNGKAWRPAKPDKKQPAANNARGSRLRKKEKL